MKCKPSGNISFMFHFSFLSWICFHVQTGMRRNKLNTVVEFPVENLNMLSHVVPHTDSSTHPDDMCYDLIGVTNHYGNMMGGHYTGNLLLFCPNTDSFSHSDDLGSFKDHQLLWQCDGWS